MTRGLVEVGRFCPNEVCPDYGKVDAGNIIHFGRTRNGTQRYRCRVCGETFTETRGTLFCRRRTDSKGILESLALLAEGVRISSIARPKGFKEDTILSWPREAGRHAQEVEAILPGDYRMSRAQIDPLWTYVGHKGEKGGMKRASDPGGSGVAP